MILGLAFTALPMGEAIVARAQGGGQTLNVAKWTGPTTLVVSGRQATIKVGDTYHMWYSSSDEKTLYHTSSTNPDGFAAATAANTFTGGTPVEVGSVTVVYEGSTYYMIAYETSTGGGNQKFAIYSSSDGAAWTYGGTVFDGAALSSLVTNFVKIDGPYLFKDEGTYRLYFQVKSQSGQRYDIYTAESTATSLDVIADGDAEAEFALANNSNPVLSPGATTDAWDGKYVMQPMVVKDGGTYYMWYSAHNDALPQQIGFASSTNGYAWVKSPGNPIIPRDVTYNAVGEPSVIKDGTTWRMWYLASDGIRYLTATGPFEFQTIQAAIDAAESGGTVNVAAGTYEEQVTINKSLSLIGAGESTTIIKAPATRTGTVVQGSTWDYIVAAYPTTGTIDVKIEGFTIDADTQAKASGTAGLIGVFFRDVKGATAGLYSCTIQNFKQVEYQSWGVRVYGDSSLTIDDNTMTDYTRDGITINGDGGAEADPAVTISNNDLTGSALPLNGISILDGASGTVSGNTVRDHTRSAEWAAVGIIVGDSENVLVNGNTVENCFYGIYLDTGANNNTVSGNTLTNTIKRGISLNDADNNVIKSNIISSATIDTLDTAIGLANGSTGNIIGGPAATDGNTITLANSGTGLLYAVYIQSNVGSGSNTIQYNTISGGTRAVQIDGGNTGTTTIDHNNIANPSFAGIYLNGGSATISGNTLKDAVRPIEFWGANNVTITENTIDGSTFDFINIGSLTGTLSPIKHNAFKNVAGGYILRNQTSSNVDAKENWWGSVAGPAAGQISGDVDYNPWCGDEDCSFLVYEADTSDPDAFQASITNTPDGGTLYVPSNPPTTTGGYEVGGITLILGDGVKIQNNSPCFTVTASHTKVTTVTIGGAVCVPTGGSNGIDVAAGLTDITIEGLEIDGTDQDTGDGINFAGAIEDVIVRDNFIHGLDGDGVHFTAQPANYVEIKGNLFMGNTGVGVEAPADLDVKYNAWGAYGGPTAGDGVSANILETSYTPWTHVDVYVEYASSSKYNGEVAVGEQITYHVRANLVNAYGAQFTLTYDPEKLDYITAGTAGTVFPNLWTGSPGEVAPGVTVDETNGKITFSGGSTSAVTGVDQFLFSVTFKGLDDTPEANPLSFAATDEALFGMNPGYGSSLNIYAAGMEGVEDVNVYDLPTLSISPLTNFAVDNPKEFTLTVTNPATGRNYTNLNVDLVVPNGATLEYRDSSGAWVAYVDGVDIGGLDAGNDADVLFRITFAVSGGKTVLVDLNDGTIWLKTYGFYFTVLDSYTVTGTVQMQGRTVRSGVSIGLAGITHPEYSYNTLSNDFMTGNYTLSNVVEGAYKLTITHDRYLDFVYGTYSTADLDLTRLELRGGDVVKNNAIDISDASLIGTNYGSTDGNEADANFDEKVDIFDLAMVGGNYDLTSTSAYTGWTP